MPLEVKDGKLVVRSGLLSTGGCCCVDGPPNCCESQGKLLQLTLEVSGLADGDWTGCDCLNGTYVADVVDVLTSTDPDIVGAGFGDSVQPQSGCIAVDQDGNEYIGHVYLSWSCTGDYAECDWGFRATPWQENDYAPTDLMRVAFDASGVIYGGTGSAGVPCAGGSASGVVGTLLINTFWTGCDYTNLSATVTVA